MVKDMRLTALCRDPKDRFQSARAFASEIRAVAKSVGTRLDDTELVPWLHGLGLFSRRSGTRPAVTRADGDLRSTFPGRFDAADIRRQNGLPVAPGRYSLGGNGPSYCTRTGAQFVWGPLTLPRLLEVAATGKLRPLALVAEGDDPYSPAVEIAALTPLLSTAAYRFDEIPSEPAWRQAFERQGLPRLLFTLAAHRASGLLVAEQGARRKRIYLSEGKPVFVTSSYRQELLGYRLAEAGLVDGDEVDGAVARAAEQGRHLGEELVNRLRALRARSSPSR